MNFLFLLLLLTSFVHADTNKSEVVIGYNPSENADLVETNGKLFSEYFQKATGVTAKTFVATDYTALVEAMRSGKVDFAFLPPFSLVKAEEIADAKVLLKASRKGKAVFYSAIITRTDKGYQKIEDLRGKNIAWVDPSSASGFIIPKSSLMTKKKINPDTFFGKQVFAGSHDALVLSVLNGTVDAGATYANDQKGENGAWHLFLKNEADRKKIKMVFVSDAIPGETMTTTNKFAKENKTLLEKSIKVFSEMHKSEEGKKILSTLYNIDAMVPATSKEYQPLRDAAKAIDLK